MSQEKLDKSDIKKITLIIIGNTTVGKSSYLKAFKGKDFSEKYLSTIGYDSILRVIRFDKIDKDLKIEIFDTAGQERYRACVHTLFRKAQGIILMYDVTSKETFDDLPKWAEEINTKAVKNVPVVLIGNKIDLIEDRLVSTEEGKKFADDNGYGFFETSVKENRLINEPILYIGERIIDSLGINLKQNKHNSVSLKDVKGKKKNCC